MNLVFKRMAQGYEEQLPFYEKMIRVAREQKSILSAAEVDLEKLFSLIEQRQELIATLEKMNQGLLSLKEEVNEALDLTEFQISAIKEKVSGAGVEALATIGQTLGDLLAEIKKLDQENETILREVMQKTQEQIRVLQDHRKVDQAYQVPTPNEEGAFIDYSK